MTAPQKRPPNARRSFNPTPGPARLRLTPAVARTLAVVQQVFDVEMVGVLRRRPPARGKVLTEQILLPEPSS